MTIRFQKRVQMDVNDALDFYREKSLEVAARFWAELQKALLRIKKDPTAFGYLGKSSFRRIHLTRFPYVVVYKTYTDCVRVFVIRHEKRNPGFGLKRRF